MNYKKPPPNDFAKKKLFYAEHLLQIVFMSSPVMSTSAVSFINSLHATENKNIKQS